MDFISKSQNGQIFKCDKCNLIHIEYKNLNFNFTLKQFNDFANYLAKIYGVKWEEKNKNTRFRRKIVIPIGHQSFRVLLTNDELEELKKLFIIKSKKTEISQNLNILNMNFTLTLN